MAHVAGLDSLRTLLISSDWVGNSGLRRVKKLSGLRDLTILMKRASPEGVAELRGSLPKLRIL